MVRQVRIRGFGVLEALVAAAVLAILVLGISKTNLGAMLSRKTLNERRMFNERVSAATSVLSIIDSCTCVIERAIRAGGGPGTIDKFARQGTAADLTFNMDIVGYWKDPGADLRAMKPDLASQCADANKPNTRDDLIFKVSNSIEDATKTKDQAGQVFVNKIEIRNIKYGGQVLETKNGTATNCAIYVADVWIEGGRTQKPNQANMVASIPVSFVIRDNNQTPTAAGLEFKKCYSKQDWENHFTAYPYAADPKNPTGTESTACIIP